VLHLEAIAGPCAGAVLTRPGELLTVGRTSKSKVHIRDAAVSERHAQLAWEGGRWLLRDVGSSNGTAVNGRQVAEGAPLPAPPGQKSAGRTRPHQRLPDSATSVSSVAASRAACSASHTPPCACSPVYGRTRWLHRFLVRPLPASRRACFNCLEAGPYARLREAGEAVALKDGDTILFGTATEVRVQARARTAVLAPSSGTLRRTTPPACRVMHAAPHASSVLNLCQPDCSITNRSQQFAIVDSPAACHIAGSISMRTMHFLVLAHARAYPVRLTAHADLVCALSRSPLPWMRRWRWSRTCARSASG